MRRRAALKALAALPLSALLSTRLYAAPGTPKLLIVFLRGGYDAANLLVPVSSDFYYAARPSIAVPRPAPAAAAPAPESALALDADWGLHPALRETLLPLYQKKQAAFVAFAGTDDLTRSHFETQDSIELGQPIAGRRDFGSGFMNRLATVLTGRAPIAFTDQLPLAFRGNVEVPNMSLRNIAKGGFDERQTRLVQSMYQGTHLAAQVDEGFALRDAVAHDIGEMETANRNAVNAKGFELEARRIARLMHERYDLGFVDIGGWDTHVGEGGATGYLAGRFDELGRGLAAYADEMGDRWRDSVVVVLSEFGRTFRENGNKGTDHGHGSVYWVLGGSLAGGRVAGEQVRVTQSTLFQNRDYPVLNDYRAVLGGLTARMYGLNAAQSEKVFPIVQPKDLGLV